MTDIEITDALSKAARLSLTDREKARFYHTLEDFRQLCRRLDEAPSHPDTRMAVRADSLRDDLSLSSISSKDILKLSEGATEEYIAVPITVEQQ